VQEIGQDTTPGPEKQGIPAESLPMSGIDLENRTGLVIPV